MILKSIITLCQWATNVNAPSKKVYLFVEYKQNVSSIKFPIINSNSVQNGSALQSGLGQGRTRANLVCVSHKYVNT